MILFTVYKHPTDYPGKWVVRRFLGMVPDEKPTLLGDSLAEVQHELLELHPHLYLLDRRPEDDPVIVETWV